MRRRNGVVLSRCRAKPNMVRAGKVLQVFGFACVLGALLILFHVTMVNILYRTPPLACSDLRQNALRGALLLKLRRDIALGEEEIASQHSDLRPGGIWVPTNCVEPEKLVIIIPYRHRRRHLLLLLFHLLPMLKMQRVAFRIYVIEQEDRGPLFNKGRLMNAGFQEAVRDSTNNNSKLCVVFHDVDMVPETYHIPYRCDPVHPVHLGAYVDSLGYQVRYDFLVGGVLAITADQFRKVNGYSNMFWAYGGEDDDMGLRLQVNNLVIKRPPLSIARYSMLRHEKRTALKPNMVQNLINSAQRRWTQEGLNSNFSTILERENRPLYTRIKVDVGDPYYRWLEPN